MATADVLTLLGVANPVERDPDGHVLAQHCEGHRLLWLLVRLETETDSDEFNRLAGDLWSTANVWMDNDHAHDADCAYCPDCHPAPDEGGE